MSEATRLDGWKAIADHVGRDPRTVQRWHHEHGMPVHHVPGNRHGTVFAYPEELDHWLTGGAPRQASSSPAGPPRTERPSAGDSSTPRLRCAEATQPEPLSPVLRSGRSGRRRDRGRTVHNRITKARRGSDSLGAKRDCALSA